MGQLTGLKGTNGKAVECVFINKGSEISAILNKGLAATTAGDKGAINIWNDDEGYIRCEAMRYCISVEETSFHKIGDVVKWANDWIIKIN